MIVRARAERLPFADRTFDLTIGSPPYLDARLYLEDGKDLGIARGFEAWVAWMLRCTAECLRVTKGPVIWVADSPTEDWTYQPAPQALMADWYRRGGSLFRPVYWHRFSIPGSGGEQWYRADVEQCLCFKRPGPLPFADPKVNGDCPLYAPGGKLSHKVRDGSKVKKGKAWGKTATSAGRNRDGTPMACRFHEPPDGQSAIANFGNLFHTPNGGGNLGHELAHANEAPYHVEVPKFFIASHCPPGGLVLDPFCGSGTTGQAALELGRRFVCGDLRQSQCLLARKRLRTITPGFACLGA